MIIDLIMKMSINTYIVNLLNEIVNKIKEDITYCKCKRILIIVMYHVKLK